MGYDLVIRNGTVIDGSGGKPFRADVAISGRRIAAIGRLPKQRGEELDAEGHVVTPGFIDGHTHMDAQVFWDPLGTCSCWHGITSVVMGNCGFTLAPVTAESREFAIQSIERAEDIGRETMARGIGEWTWNTFPEYLAAVDALPKGMHIASQIGHSALRTWAMGNRAFTEEATEIDFAIMEQQLASALSAGAVGFSTSRDPVNHRTVDNRPVPSCAATWDEITRLVDVVGQTRGAIFEIAPEPDARSSDPEIRMRWTDKMKALALTSGVPITGPLSMHLIDDTTSAGGRMFGQVHSRGISIISSFRTRLPFDDLPEWQAVRTAPLEHQRKLLSDPSIRDRLVVAVHQGEYPESSGAELRKPDFDQLRVFDHVFPPYPTITEAASERRVDPVELMIDLALASNFDQLFIQFVNPASDRSLLRAMRHPQTIMTFSDAGAHVSQISDCSIQTYLLAYWVRERQDISLEEAVRMITLKPARAWGFSQRGLLREGFVADINVFDPDSVGPMLPEVTADLPDGAKRLTQRALGFAATIVNGEVVHLRGSHTGALPGRLLRLGS